jgi:DNA-binding MarR family transcriptional regulator
VGAANPLYTNKQPGAAHHTPAPTWGAPLARLSPRGWVERVRSTKDRRAMHIHLTASGEELVERAEKIAATMENPALRALSAAERALLIELLLKVATGKASKRG